MYLYLCIIIGGTCIYVYMYIYVYICIYMYIYVYGQSQVKPYRHSTNDCQTTSSFSNWVNFSRLSS